VDIVVSITTIGKISGRPNRSQPSTDRISIAFKERCKDNQQTDQNNSAANFHFSAPCNDYRFLVNQLQIILRVLIPLPNVLEKNGNLTG
jgi:hypothetical protein